MSGLIEEPMAFQEERDAREGFGDGEDPRELEATRDWRDMLSDAEHAASCAYRAETWAKRLLFIQAAQNDLILAENAAKDARDREANRAV